MGLTVCFAGMTHLGLCSAAGAAERGFDVLCFDPDPDVVRNLEAGRLPVVEPGLEDALARCAARIRFASDPVALREADLIYVAPDVATNDAGESDDAFLRRLLDAIERDAAPEAIRIVLSQVAPGFTRPYAAGRANVFYQVETLVFGDALKRAREPERFILGCPDPSAPLPAPLVAYLSAYGCPILPMRFESAELAKIAINCCLVASISTANVLAELCERIDADWSEIAPALRLDRRIGPYAYLAPGLGLAGGNLERDLATVTRLARANGTDDGLVAAWLANSARRREWPIARTRAALGGNLRGAAIGVLGLAYKENTRSIKNSVAIAYVRALESAGARPTVYDPAVLETPGGTRAADPLTCCEGADLVAVMTPWPEFRSLAPRAIAARMRGKFVLDPYRLLDAAACADAGLIQIGLGLAGPAAAPPARRPAVS